MARMAIYNVPDYKPLQGAKATHIAIVMHSIAHITTPFLLDIRSCEGFMKSPAPSIGHETTFALIHSASTGV